LKKTEVIVITYGTFDLFHVGHVRLLKRLRELGDKLYVGISTDNFNKRKGKESFFSYDERYEILNACRYVDFVFPESNWEQKVEDVEKYEVDIFAMGDDWEGKFDFLKDKCQVLYLPRTENISTTEIKKELSSLANENLVLVENTLHRALDVIKSLSKA